MLTTEQRALYLTYRRENPLSSAEHVLRSVKRHNALAALEAADVVRFVWEEDSDYEPFDVDEEGTAREIEALNAGELVPYVLRLQVKINTGTDMFLPNELQEIGARLLCAESEREEWRDAGDVLDPMANPDDPCGGWSAKIDPETRRAIRDESGEIVYQFNAMMLDVLGGIVVDASEGTEFGTYRRECEIDMAASCGLVA